jgi:hypothetical protein
LRDCVDRQALTKTLQQTGSLLFVTGPAIGEAPNA